LKVLLVVFLASLASLLVWASEGLPDRADPQAPANQHVSPEYLIRAQEETGVPNVVTAVLADYRGYDTLGELIVIVTAGLGCVLVLKVAKKP
jgi:multicomponent Na+:H+ antiporter subunit B